MAEAFPQPEHNNYFPEKDLTSAEKGFERMAKRINELWMKDTLTRSEQEEIDLLINNAMVMQDLFDKKTPEEFQI